MHWRLPKGPTLQRSQETVESDFLGSCAEQMAEAMEGFERLVAQARAKCK